MDREQVKSEFGGELFGQRNMLSSRGEPASQEAVGKMIGVTGSTISSWERGYTFPTRENFDAAVKVFPKLDKDKYRDAILMDWVNSSGPNNPNPSRAPRTSTTTPNRVVNMAGKTKHKTGEQKLWDTPLTFKSRLQNGRFKNRMGARRVLTKAVDKNIKNSWTEDERKSAFAQIDAHFLAQETRSSAAAAANKYHRQSAEEFRFKLAGGVYRTSKEARRAIGRMSSISEEERDALREDVDSYFSVPDEPEEPTAQAVQPPIPTAALVSPPRTELIQFHNITIEAFKDPTGNGYWGQLSTICDPIGVDTKNQRIKLQERSWAKGKVVQITTLHPDGSPRTGSPPWYVHSSIIGMWLATMHENNVPEGPIREALIKLQLQLCDVLDRHFHMRHTATPTDILMLSLMEHTRRLVEVTSRLSTLEDLVRRLVEPPAKEPDRVMTDSPEQAPVDGWLANGSGGWNHRDGRYLLEENVFILELYRSPGIATAREELGVSLDSETLEMLGRRVNVTPKIIVRGDKEIRLWPAPSFSSTFANVLRSVNNWLRCGAPTFKTNGSGRPEFDVNVAWGNLNKKYGPEIAGSRLSDALKADREFLARLEA